MTDPTPYRSPLGYERPTVVSSTPITVQVSFPNEDPDTEDDLTLNFAFTTEGIIIDLFVSDGEPVATLGQMYDEFANTLVDLDRGALVVTSDLFATDEEG